LTAVLLAVLAPLVVPDVKAREETPVNTLTAPEQQDGWKLLFDGKSTARCVVGKISTMR
jgi:hypothetical protein